jgi:uncharacterized protein YggL (DUF469 family)
LSAPCPVLGFTISARLLAPSSDGDAEAMTNDLHDLLDANELMVRGGGYRELKYIVHREGSQATNADRELVVGWAGRWRSVARIEISDVVDVSSPD